MADLPSGSGPFRETRGRLHPHDGRAWRDNQRRVAFRAGAYFERFQRIATSSSGSKVSLAEGLLGDATAEAREKHTPARNQRIVLKPVEIPETLLFYVRLGPRLELKLTRPQLEPEPAVERLSTKDRVRQTQALSKNP